MSSESVSRRTASASVADFLASFSIFASLLGIAWHPLRLIPVSVLVAIVAAGMRGRQGGLPLVAIGVGAASFFLGLSLAVATQNPIW